MNILRNFIFNNKNINKNAYIWNMFAGISSALESVIFSIIITRVNGLTDAGIVTIGFAIGNLMATIGKYGVRTFQVTDVNGRYSFSTYLYTRLITIFIMCFSCGIYICYCYNYKCYSLMKTIAVILLCLKFVIEVFEDVYAGECQKLGRLDVSSKIYVIRSISFVIVFTIFLIFTHNLLLSLIITVVNSVFLEIIMIRYVIINMKLYLNTVKFYDIGGVIIKCLPLFLSAFFFFYITNAPKYAIDTVMNDEVQACYSFIAFPVFAIELLNNFIYQPSLVDLAKEWAEKQFTKVKRRMHTQLLIILGLTSLALCIAYFLGIPVLSFVFSTDLIQYKTEMLVLLLGGGLLATMGYLSTILVTMRHSVLMIYGYTVIFIISLFAYNGVIMRYHVLGGAVLYCMLCFSFAIYEYIAIMIIFKRSIIEASKSKEM